MIKKTTSETECKAVSASEPGSKKRKFESVGKSNQSTVHEHIFFNLISRHNIVVGHGPGIKKKSNDLRGETRLKYLKIVLMKQKTC